MVISLRAPPRFKTRGSSNNVMNSFLDGIRKAVRIMVSNLLMSKRGYLAWSYMKHARYTVPIFKVNRFSILVGNFYSNTLYM